MPRPVVLVATTDPAMAFALQARLKEPCRKLGLRLDVCPDGDKEERIGDKDVRVYDSAEALFDALEKRDPFELADTLVVLDVGAELENAFKSKASDDEAWHGTGNRAGVAVELMLRFPQVFPVFLSPAVPVEEGAKDAPPVPNLYKNADNCRESGCWASFRELKGSLAMRHKPGSDSEPVRVDNFNELFALTTPLHFVSPLDHGAGLESVLNRFARGMRCWFDPTGLRTLVKNRFLVTVFGSDSDWSNTWSEKKDGKESGLRTRLLERLDKSAVAVDEEREFALLSAYAAWKYGRRAWVVTTYGEFENEKIAPLWHIGSCPAGSQCDYKRCDQANVIVLRDVDIRFPDISDKSDKKGIDKKGIRDELKNIGSGEWKDKLRSSWNVRAISGDVPIRKHVEDFCREQARLGQNPIKEKIEKKEHVEYLGFPKPINSLYELREVLGKEAKPAANSLISTLGAAKDGEGGHGAPYLNLAMAESLLRHSVNCKDSPSAHFIGALLAMEAYELLLGMSKTTALEALLTMHRHEVIAEVNFPGVSHAIELKERKRDIEETLNSLYDKNETVKVKNMYLSQFWAELRIAYREGEQFTAAEAANIESLHNGYPWLPHCVLLPATSLIWWGVAFVVMSLFFAALYALASPIECLDFWDVWWKVIVSMLMVQGEGDVINTAKDGFIGASVFLAHMAVSYVLLGLLISMLYRKVTRG